MRAAISSKRACARCLTGMRRVAMEYSPGCAIPYVVAHRRRHDRAGAAVGVEVVSSGDLSSASPPCGTPRHRHASRASDKLYRVKDRAFEAIAQRHARRRRHDRVRHPAADGRLVSRRGARQRLGPERLRRRRTPATRTTCRPRAHSRRFGRDELVLLDLWGKLDRPGAVFADITWVGLPGRSVPERSCEGVRGRSPPRATRRSASCSAPRAAGERLRGWRSRPRRLGRAARRRIRRQHPAPDRPQPGRNRPRQRREHGRLRNPRRPPAAARHRLSPSSRASTSTTSASGRKSTWSSRARRHGHRAACRPRFWHSS